MARAATNTSLFISIDGSISGLQAATKAGKSVLLDFDAAAGPIVDQISTKLRDMGAGSADGAKEAVGNYTRALAQIKDSVQAAANSPQAALKLFDVNALNQQIEKAEQAAATNRLVAETAQQVAAAGGPNAQQQLAIAAAFGTAAASGEEEVRALRDQAVALGEVRTQLVATGAIQESTGRSIVVSAGQQRQGVLQIGEQFRQFATEVQLGINPITAFTQQSGQAAFALTNFGGTAGKVGEVLAGPFGTLALVAVGILGQMAVETLKANSALDAAVKKLKDDAHEADIARAAHEAFKSTVEGQIITQQKLNDELDRSIRTQRQLSQLTLFNAQKNLAAEQQSRADLTKQIADQQKVIDAFKASPGVSTDGAPSVELSAASAAQAKLNTLRATLAQTNASIAWSEQAVNEAQAPLISSEVEAALDKRTAATLRFTKALGLLNAELTIGAGKKGFTNEQQPDRSFVRKQISGISSQTYQSELLRISQERDAAIKAANDEKKSSSGSPSLALLHSAESFRGADENSASGRSILQSLFSQAGISIDPKITAWCAAFVNAVLATNGLPGTGPQNFSAAAFAKYGTATDAPQKGDIVVSKRTGGGHVGFFDGFDKNGNVRVLGGNTGDKVGDETVKRSDVVAFRRAPSSAQDATDAAAKTAQKEADRQAASDQLQAKAKADYLQAAQALAANEEERLDAAIATIQADRDTHDAAVARAVTDKKITSAVGDELKAANDKTADAKIALATNRSIEKAESDKLQLLRDELQKQAALLDIQAQLADTNKQRKNIALQQLLLEENNARAVANTNLASHDPKVAAEGQKQLDQVNAEAPGKREVLDKQFADPLQQYLNRLKANTGDMNDALKGVAANGLQSLEDGLVGIANGTETVAGAFKKMATSILADLARIAIEKLIVNAIGGSFFGIFKDGTVPGHATGLIPGFADGVISGPGTGTSDSILAVMAGKGLIRVSNGESIITAAATQKYGPLLKAMNDNTLPGFADGLVSAPNFVPRLPPLPSASSLQASAQTQPRQIVFDMRGAVMTQDLLQQMQAIANDSAGQVVAQYAPAIVDAATSNTVAQLSRPSL